MPSSPFSPVLGQPVLFFDLAEVARMHHVRQVVCGAKRHPHNPVMPLGDLNAWDSGRAAPWAGRSVLYDEQDRVFKMWYSGQPATEAVVGKQRRTGYAISHDGVVWEKPALGLYEFNGDAKRNNICAEYFGCVIKDEREPDPARRYKMFVKHSPLKTRNMGISYSADGLTWGGFVDLPSGPDDAWSGRPGDTVVFLRDDQDPDPTRRFKMMWQTLAPAAKAGPPEIRVKNLAYGPDELHWRASPSNPVLSPNDGQEQENHFLAYVPYQGQYLMLYEHGWYEPDGTGLHGRYAADIRLAHSRDGEHFTRICPADKVIPRGSHGDWDEQFLVISDSIVVKDGLIHLYYSGQDDTWTSWPPQNKVERHLHKTTADSRHSRTGLATIGVDRFSAFEALDLEMSGSVETVPVSLPQQPATLALNLSNVQAGRSWVTVAVQDAAGEPIPSFSREQCRPLATDSLAAEVVWGDRSLRELHGQTVALRFWLYGSARLHAVYFNR